MKRIYSVFALLIMVCGFSQQGSIREKILIDDDWKFAFGHQYDVEKDFGHGTSYFSYLAKAGYGDGPAAADYDDRAWRSLDLPHDWAVEQLFDEKASFSHGFKAAGKGFPEKNIGWYRKTMLIPQSDIGRKIVIKFDGVFRNSKVFFNGYYLGNQESGYNGFEYDVSAYVNYGQKNTIAVRVDASMEEGWYYEGAGIYRHVYLEKTEALKVKSDGVFVYTEELEQDKAVLNISAEIENKERYTGKMKVFHTVLDPSGKEVAFLSEEIPVPEFYGVKKVSAKIKVDRPLLWDLETPNLYRLITEIKYKDHTLDQYTTTFGIRTIRFDADKGFFLNGKPVKIKGTNNHQEHAGVGTAIPDELQYFRIKKLKEMGSNAYRTSHHPPTPELLEACDKLGMLVIDEVRLMGINDFHLDQISYLIERDRNHPSVICWSVGNEEWMIEGNDKGEKITEVMQHYAQKLDLTRPVTVGISSGFKSGISSVVEIMGYNYLGNGDIDAHRKEFKHQPGMGTEEGSTFATRGVYITDDHKHYKAAYDQKPRPTFYSIEEGWKFYSDRPYLAGMFIWTGFDYRGEPTPYGWPSVSSYFGMMDTCGFPKDNVYYLKSWWSSEPVLHILPHWNWEGREGKEIDVWVYSNVDEVELFLNKKSFGKKEMETNGHLEWKVPYQKGTLEAIGYRNGKRILYEIQKTTKQPERIKMTSHKDVLTTVKDLAIISVEVIDKDGLHIPTADHPIKFSLKGGGKIIGVGNGDPTSLEKDKFIDELKLIKITDLKEQKVSKDSFKNLSDLQDNNWTEAFKTKENETSTFAYKGNFNLDEEPSSVQVVYYYKELGTDSAIFINGDQVRPSGEDVQKYNLDSSLLNRGENTIHIIAGPQVKKRPWDELNKDPGLIQSTKKQEPWKRKLFNGYAQIIIQNDGTGEDIVLEASSPGIKPGKVVLKKNDL
ncbi:beta-galactosidase GalA [Chryseobacterium sp. CT-SW4]|uniref:beta-galactosidase GalA n=1 Tax=Chryseobacterium sp. SW-1 TaxID=3157343 RepID=UPI003B0184D4